MRVLELFIHSGCFSRINGPGLIQEVLRDFPDISFKEIDMLREAERVAHLGVKISPTLVLDGRIISISIPDKHELKTILRGKEERISYV